VNDWVGTPKVKVRQVVYTCTLTSPPAVGVSCGAVVDTVVVVVDVDGERFMAEAEFTVEKRALAVEELGLDAETLERAEGLGTRVIGRCVYSEQRTIAA
jgi:hypothetical protein